MFACITKSAARSSTTTTGTKRTRPSFRVSLTTYRPETADARIGTRADTFQLQRTIPVSRSIGHGACGTTANGPPDASGRAPAPPYQPRRYSFHDANVRESAVTITFNSEPGGTHTRSAYA